MMDLFQNPSSLRSNRFETAIWAVKLVLMSMGIISTLVLLKVSIIPHTFHLVLSTLPQLWVSARSWLSPPFMYIILNFIIITIAASSNFHHKSTHFSDSPAPSDHPKHTAAAAATDPAVVDTDTHPSEPENQSNEPREEEKVVVEDAEFKDSGLSCNKPIADPSPEKCANDYFSPDSDENGDDTLDATWRAIMEGEGKTKKPQLKKSDTWAARITKAEPFQDNGENDDDPVAWARKELRKSDTFNDTVSLRREKSESPEELNRRAEAFIKMFNNQMKLQRLESYRRSLEMVNRGL